MQRNDLALKRKLLYDGEELQGLVSTSALSDEKETTEAPGFKRKRDISTGVKKVEPITCLYKISSGTTTKKFLSDYYQLDQVKDLTIISLDGTGEELDRDLWPDTECVKFNKREYDAGGVTHYGIEIILVCTGIPQQIN